ncbi:monovalent cation/H(+) antiporter subunit G [Billgrantia aerodenitrificans]|uniref:Monovalent cation/H(+) antiporter subunit G n=1 Tax=Billgrantia aerodenitrificans TaxID=2733483 RepID=A0ABS9ASF7_9GAMM|nr:monovalent cation/H(+) antiporter subunit G [Halomonas aerodenitrificans]MCE8024561.1 monovalent cation/H(+) antiporter subunit G [Halomonas aerodenitrificans]
MTEWLEVVSHLLVVAGTLFFVTGSLGFIRFPDVFTRLHALTKADNLGLGLLCSGLALQADGLAEAAKIMLIWLLVLLASGIGATLVASTAAACGIRPWQNRTGASREAQQEPQE